LLNESAENEATDTTKTIDCDFYCHGRLRVFKCCLLELDWVIARERRERRKNSGGERWQGVLRVRANR
jgi:hypothetical protein